MRKKKIRGHRRRWRIIELWILNAKKIDLTNLTKNDYGYVKFRVHPWSSVSFTNSINPNPNKATKSKIIQGLLDIYDGWEKQLKQTKELYYLCIWLFEPRISMSQIVYATGENIDFYKNTFSKPLAEKPINLKNYGNLESSMKSFNWSNRLDEDYLTDQWVGNLSEYKSIEDFNETKKEFEKLLKLKHRVIKLDTASNVEIKELYAFKKGTVWLSNE